VWTRFLVCGYAVLAVSCGGPATAPSPPPETSGVLVGAADIGQCGSGGPEATARLLDGISGTVFTAGDNAYFQGTAQQFLECYHPSWGRHRVRTRPSPGNHDYESAGAAPYFAYFGSNAGPAGLGYYSFEVGSWHVVSLNSNISMAQGSAQQAWLQADLASSRATCTAAFWHHPLFSVGHNPPTPEVRDLWRTLYAAGADVVINGHNHMYERYAPQTPDGVADPAKGIREFVAGTGGADLYQFTLAAPNNETYVSTWGVLKLTLGAGNYRWEFINTSGHIVDSGGDTCR
jgi:hypothetical protein